MKNTMLAAGSLSLALMAGCAGTKPADQTAASTDTSAQKQFTSSQRIRMGTLSWMKTSPQPPAT